jgi:hypothetical protein
MPNYVRYNSEFLANTTTVRSQAQAEVARLTNGNFISVWIDADFNTTAGRNIRAQVFTPDGAPVGGELTLLANANGAIHPNITGLTGGGFAISWLGLGSLQVQTFGVNGTPTSSVISVPAGSSIGRPEITALANGGFALAWQDNRTTGGDITGSSIHVRQFSATGLASGADTLANTATIGNQGDPSITALANGNYVVTWTDRGAGWVVKAQLFDAAGARLGGERLINTTPIGVTSVESSVAATSSGGFVAAWYETTGAGPYFWVRAFDAAGNAVGLGLSFPAAQSGTATGPVITTLSDGSIAVAWEGSVGTQSDSSGRGIYVQVIDPNGSPIGSPMLANTQTVGDQIDPAIIALSGGRFAVTWTDLNGPTANDDDVKIQIFGPQLPLAIQSDGGSDTAARAVAENQLDVTTVRASGVGVTYGIIGGEDGTRFTIDATTGVLRFTRAPDREAPTDSNSDNVYTVIVRASDGTQYDTQSITVTVTNVNDNAPSLTPFRTVSGAENTTFITTVSANDADGDLLTYSIAGGDDAARFVIDTATGALSFAAAPDFEAPTDLNRDNVYQVAVRASDGAFVTTQTLSVAVANTNDNAPTMPASITISQSENLALVTNVVATDADRDALAYSIVGGDDRLQFSIDPMTGALRFVTAPDFEAPADANGDNVYQVIVRASDGTFSNTQALSIAVTNVNDVAPVLPATATLMRNENTAFVTTVAATDRDGDGLTYSIVSGADAAQFTIDAATGVLSFRAAPDFESPADANGDNVYEITVLASDGLFGATQAVSINIANVNDNTPSMPGLISVGVAENTTTVTAIVATDADRDALTFAISGGADAALFAINATTGALSFVAAPDREAPTDADRDNHYQVSVTASDGAFVTTQSLDVNVSDVNDNAPVIVSSGGGTAATAAISEGVTAVLRVAATDADSLGSIVYSIAGGDDAARFVIDAMTGALAFVTVPDFETPVDADRDNRYQVVVAASDGLFATTQSLTVAVSNINDNAPVLISNGGGATAVVGVAEGTTGVTTVAAIDPDGGPLNYSIIGGDDATRFVIDSLSGALSFASAPDFEQSTDANGDNVYQVTVRASDGQFAATQTLAIAVANTNDNAPVFTSAAAATTTENSTSVTIVVATDADRDSVTYAITGGADAGLFAINAISGTLSFVAAPDFESPADSDHDNRYQVSVTARDGLFASTQDLTVSVTNVNDIGPVIVSNGGGALASISIAEETRTVTTIMGSDAEGDALTYSIVGGADAGRFLIDAATGRLDFAALPDFEVPADFNSDNIYDVVVAARDGIFSATQTLAVTVRNINDGTPVITSNGGGATASIGLAENLTLITTVTATDPDGSALTYAVTGGADAARFAIDSTTGVLRFVSAPDFEAPGDADGNNVYDVIVTASDGVFTDTQALTISVTNVNDNAPVIHSNGGGATAAVAIDEDSAAVATVRATDADGLVPGYAIIGGADATRFVIDAATGALRFAAAPDFEAPADADRNNVYDVVVAARDGAFSTTQALAVTVRNLNDTAPVITSNGGGAIAAIGLAENMTTVTTAIASDPDGAPLRYSITGGADAARFGIDAVTGALRFLVSPDFEAPADADRNNVYDVTIAATDGTFIDTQVLAITIGNANDNVPVFVETGSLFAVAENRTNIWSLAATDADGSALRYSIAGGADASFFAIEAATGQLSFRTAADFENPLDAGRDNWYDVTVAVNDGAQSIFKTIRVQVYNEVEGAYIVGTSAANTISTTATVAGQALATVRDDYILAGGGADTLNAGGGNDWIYGEAGNDKLNGEGGRDWLFGGAGADQFIFSSTADSTVAAPDFIGDFSRAEGDRISLSAIDANILRAADQAFTFIGTGAFTGVAGQLHYEYVDGNTFVTGDVNGDRIPDFGIMIAGTQTLVAADFVL